MEREFRLKFKPQKVMSINYSLLMTLPAHWCNGFSLKKGDILDVSITSDGTLVVRPTNG